jgi:hypothetical protein
MGDDRNLTMDDLRDAAAAAGISVEQVAQNIQETVSGDTASTAPSIADEGEAKAQAEDSREREIPGAPGTQQEPAPTTSR